MARSEGPSPAPRTNPMALTHRAECRAIAGMSAEAQAARIASHPATKSAHTDRSTKSVATSRRSDGQGVGHHQTSRLHRWHHAEMELRRSGARVLHGFGYGITSGSSTSRTLIERVSLTQTPFPTPRRLPPTPIP